MANIKQQKKRVRIAARERVENLRYRSTIKTLTKRLERAAQEGKADEVSAEHRELVRLIDLAPDGAALRVSYQVLNLTHRDSPAEPTPLEPGKRTRVKVKLNDCGHRFASGHRIRVSISSGYWPMIWPAPIGWSRPMAWPISWANV